ncbi:hypothetical protein BH23CHL10_BH23CHL10_10630 [soil metagenome]
MQLFGRPGQRWAWLGISADPYLFYTATLVPIAVVVALAGRQAVELAAALLTGALAIAVQALLGRIGASHHLNGRVPWQLVRLVPPIAFVAIASRLIGGPSLPLIAMFIPIVAAAAASGATQGATAAALVAFVLLVPELSTLGSTSPIGLRAITLAGVTLVLAFGTRRIVRALEQALVASRAAMVAERRRTRQIAALETVGRLLAAGGESSGQMEPIVDVIARQFGYSHVSVYLGDARWVQLAAQRGYTTPIPSFDGSAGVAGRVMSSGQLAFVADVSTDPDWIAGEAPVTSLICAPLTFDNRFLGLLNVETRGARRLDETDRSLVMIMATRVASAVALGLDRHKLASRAELFRDVEAFGREVTGSLALEPLARMMVEAIGRVVKADTLVVTLLDRSDGCYRVRGVRGVAEAAVGREIEIGEGLTGRAIRDRAIVIDDTQTPDKIPRTVRDLNVPPLAQGVCLPLISDGVVVGAFAIGRTTHMSRFTDLEVEGLQLLASSAALAVANAFLHAEVAEMAVRDSLTGLYNRRHFDAALDRMLAAHRRERLTGQRPLSAIFFDLDHFGLFNRDHGHQAGDQVLKVFAEVLVARFRTSDLVARIGGEEFVAVLDGADLSAAMAVANDVRELLERRSVRAEDGTELRVTVSAGCAQLGDEDSTSESLLRAADRALFMAKRAGRDRVVAA